MLFNSIAFAIFLPLVFTVYWSFSKNRKVQNVLLLGASYLFYSFWDWRFLGLILLSSLVDYVAGLQIEKNIERQNRRKWLLLSLIVNLGILFFFKYSGFFIREFSELLNYFGLKVNESSLQIILPVGISFYTFQTLSYTIDIYRGKIKATKDALSFFTYVAFFPQLVAGPIERAKHLLPQFQKDRIFTYEKGVSGLQLILWGLFKKTVVADRLAQAVNLVYENPEAFSSGEVILATLFFGVQIYCDFSGYSDIAIGTARLLGFDLMENFRAPYFAKSLKEFWQRWHISLSTWFRDYVYIPLGGNKGTPKRWMINILLTFLISGLWHGANWTFLAWGAIHGLFYIFENRLNGMEQFRNIKFPSWLKVFSTFSIVMLAWVFFRAATIGEAFLILQQGFVFEGFDFSLLFESSRYAWYTLLFVILTFIIDWLSKDGNINSLLNPLSKPLRWLFLYFLLFVIIFFGEFQSAPEFIYFQF